MFRSSWILSIAVAVVCLGFIGAGCSSDSAHTNPIHPDVSPATDPLDVEAGIVSVELQALGCPGDSMGGGNGRLERTILSSLSLTFDTVRLYPACPDSEGTGMPDCDPGAGRHHGGDQGWPGEGGYIEVLTNPVTVDVLDLGEELTALLGTLQIPTGAYTHLALRITEATGVTEDGDAVLVEIANRENLLKIQVPFEIEGETATEIVIVIDLGRSVREVPPGSGDFLLKPVLRGEDRGHHTPGDGNHRGEGGNGHGRGGAF